MCIELYEMPYSIHSSTSHYYYLQMCQLADKQKVVPVELAIL